MKRKILTLFIGILLVGLVIGGLGINALNKEVELEGNNESFIWKGLNFNNSQGTIRCVYIENYAIMPRCTNRYSNQTILEEESKLMMQEILDEINNYVVYEEDVLVDDINFIVSENEVEFQ